MALATYPVASAGGGIKAVQRGLAATAGTVTITAVNTAKAFVNVFGTTSSGSAAISGNINAASGSMSAPSGNTAAANIVGGTGSGIGGNLQNSAGQNQQIGAVNAFGWSGSGQNVGLNATNMAAGTTNLVAAVVQGYLSGSTSLVVSGPCRWEVVEFA